MIAELHGNQPRIFACEGPAQTEANWMEADGWTEVIVTDESEDAISCGGLCCIY